MVPSDIQPGRIYCNNTGKIVRLVLARVTIPDQADQDGIKYEIIKAPAKNKRGTRNGLGFVGLCTADRFAVWAKEDLTGSYAADPYTKQWYDDKKAQIESGVYGDD